jgi:hypothetical protein
VALRLWLLPDLPLSQYQLSYNGESSQFWDVLIDVGFGSPADLFTDNSLTAASEGKAAPRVEYFQNPNLSVSFSR